MANQSSPSKHSPLDASPQCTLSLINDAISQLTLLVSRIEEKTDFAEEVMKLVDKIQLACDRDSDAAQASIFILEGFNYPVKHSIDTALLSEGLARKMSFDRKEKASIIAAALTMNISFILEQQIRSNSRDSSLSPKQTKSIQNHPQESVKILKKLNVTDELWLTAVLEHHEKLDGSGYPNHISGKRFFLPAQIISICDQYLESISPKGYRDISLHKKMLRQLFLDHGHQISEELENLFVKQVGIYPVGTIVRMANLEVGQVAKQGQSLNSPEVYACSKSGMGNYQFPIIRDTSIEEYEISEILDHLHPEVTFDKTAIWQLNENQDQLKSPSITSKPVTSESRDDYLDNINEKIDELPLLPIAVSQLMGLSIDDENYFVKVHHLAEQDPTFAIRLIRQANTVENTSSISKITTLERAITRIGTRQVKGLITTFAVTKIFVPSNKSEVDLWVHAIQVAVTAQALASMNEQLKIDPEQAYLCGLLHDIGRFILFKIMPNGPLKIDEHDWQTPTQLVFAEEEACGLNHAELGARASKRWNLSEDISHIILRHHDYRFYPSTTIAERQSSLLTKIIQVADNFSMLAMKKPDVLELPNDELHAILNNECLNSHWEEAPVDIRALCDESDNILIRANQLIKELNILE